MNVEVWSSKEGKGYEYSEGKLDDEFDGFSKPTLLAIGGECFT